MSIFLDDDDVVKLTGKNLNPARFIHCVAWEYYSMLMLLDGRIYWNMGRIAD